MKKQDKLVLAVYLGNIKEVKKMLVAGANINTKDSTVGGTLIIHAAETGNGQLTKFLMKNGADIKVSTATGYTLLHAASHGGIDWLVRRLIKKGLDVNVQEKDKGDTPLILAALEGHLSTVKLLLKNGASLNARNKAERTVLHAALLRENKEMIDILLKEGIKMTKTEIQLMRIFMYCRNKK
jgi:uncharacterized protein